MNIMNKLARLEPMAEGESRAQDNENCEAIFGLKNSKILIKIDFRNFKQIFKLNANRIQKKAVQKRI